MKFMNSAILLSLMASSVCFAAETYDAVVSPVNDGSANHYTKIYDAIQAAKKANSKPFVIFIKDGTYNEKLTVDANNVTLLGEDKDKTIIEYGVAAGMMNPQGKPWGTSGSYVVLLKGDHITLKNLTVRNTFDYPKNDEKENDDPTKLVSSQAVALSVNNKANHINVLNTVIDGYQDTLLLNDNSKSYFKDCTVKGNVDFIFGGGTGVFDSCNIVAKKRTIDTKPMGYITAPSTEDNVPYGLVFINSRLTKEAGVPEKSFGLGRPWHPTRKFADGSYADPHANGQTLYINCYMDNHLFGWDQMPGKDVHGDMVYFSPEKDARFFEYDSTGPGGKALAGRNQLSDAQAKQATLSNILGSDWFKS